MNKVAALIILSMLGSFSIAEERIIAVEGSGVVEAVPDLIRIGYNVFSLSKNDPSEAKAKVDEISSLSVQSLLKLGIAEKDITSSSLNIETAEDYNDNGNALIIGHLVRRNIDIVIRDVSLYGEVIQALVDSHVSEIDSIKPDVSNYEELKREALANAAQSAKSNAEFLAKQFGAELDKVHQIGKQNTRRQYSLEEIVVTGSKRRASNIKSTQYEFKPGNVKVSSEIYVEFQLK
ncbi:SIMPL domain-containing protein [Microbulbifer sp. VAAF005]|uniref:SIMPL domain-containing protein n=1 Tax=Microbulbifer sp. VAAF005 TaxID=3034230 RepID=UPI0024ACDE5F|nr:SIMPL domain-containing protein [Microbulbifer sp. VAAF005]WHI47642.1 SIMPL domain-containing protein [Microbulbifer sp. VAAF005]